MAPPRREPLTRPGRGADSGKTLAPPLSREGRGAGGDGRPLSDGGVVADALVGLREVIEALELGRELVRDAVVVDDDAIMRGIERCVAPVRGSRVLPSLVRDDAFVVFVIAAFLAIAREIAILASIAMASRSERGEGQTGQECQDRSHGLRS